jgi:hypothetical protein
VSASIGIPEACGDFLTYSVHDYGKFHDDPEDDMMSIERALVLYIDTVSFGLKSAFAVLRAIENDELLEPKPASGQCLRIGGKKLDCVLCASPITDANGFFHKGHKLNVSQGELFAGSLNLHAINFKGTFATFFDKALKNSVKVIVKVSSVAVHFWLVDPSHAFSALKEIQLTIAGSRAVEPLTPEKIKRMNACAVLQAEISSVVYAAVRTNAGILTIMSDLSDEYNTLSAKAHRDKVSVLWEGFRHLVNNVLLPLASMQIVHADIRPGFDETSNVLLAFGGEPTGSTASLKLIDYESLVGIMDWRAPSEKGNYIQRQSAWTATTFVWWQCLAVAYAWKEEIPASDFAKDNGDNSLVRRLKKDFCLTNVERKELGWKPLLPATFAHYADQNEISEQVVTDTLVELANHFN